MLTITEIFFSLQGESTYAGLPCIFIRLTGCNLRCSYCDTDYSYENGIPMTVSDIMDQVHSYKPVKLVEITGGEPLLQKEVYDLMSALNTDGYTILMETNGSVSIQDVPDFVHCITDVKTPDSGFGNSFELSNLESLKAGRDELKFVLSSRTDYNWAVEFLNNHGLWNHTILFSCVYNKLQPKTLAEWLIEDKLPVRFQLQLHKYIWSPETRGV